MGQVVEVACLRRLDAETSRNQRGLEALQPLVMK